MSTNTALVGHGRQVPWWAGLRLRSVAAMALGVMVGILAWGVPVPAACGQGFSFSVSPMLVEVEGQPGSTQTFSITIVADDAGQPGEFTTSVRPVMQDLTGNYRLAAAEASRERSAVDWIQVSPATFTLSPGQAQVIQGRVTFPRQYRGGAYAAVMISLQPDRGPSEGARQIFQPEFMAVVEATAVTQGVQAQIYIDKLAVVSARQKGMEAYAQAYGLNTLLFVAQVVNEGNVHAPASGSISIWDAQGRKLNQFPLGSGRGMILPGATVQMGSILPRGLPAGDYTMQVVVNYGGGRPAVARQTFAVGQDELQSMQAGRGLRVQVDPELVSLDLTAGGTRYLTVRVQNLDKVPIDAAVELLPLVYDVSGSANTETVALAPASAAGWLVLRPDHLTVAPGTSRNLLLGVRVPREVAAGGHYAQLVVTASATPDSREAATTTTTTTATTATTATDAARTTTVLSVPVHVLVGDESPGGGELSPLEVALSEDKAFLVLSTVFTNHGKVHAAPTAEVFLERKTEMPASQAATGDIQYVGDVNWTQVSKVTVPAVTVPVLPEGQRNLGAVLAKPEQAGEYRLRVVIRYGATAALTQQVELILSPDGIKKVENGSSQATLTQPANQ